SKLSVFAPWRESIPKAPDMSIPYLIEFPHGITIAFVGLEKERFCFAHCAGDRDPIEHLAAIVAGGVDALFGGTSGQRRVLAVRHEPCDRFRPLVVDPASQRSADVHGEAAASNKGDALLTLPCVDKSPHHAPKRETSRRQR